MFSIYIKRTLLLSTNTLNQGREAVTGMDQYILNYMAARVGRKFVDHAAFTMEKLQVV